jgi:hypothetical protein
VVSTISRLKSNARIQMNPEKDALTLSKPKHYVISTINRVELLCILKSNARIQMNPEKDALTLSKPKHYVISTINRVELFYILKSIRD